MLSIVPVVAPTVMTPTAGPPTQTSLSVYVPGIDLVMPSVAFATARKAPALQETIVYVTSINFAVIAERF